MAGLAEVEAAGALPCGHCLQQWVPGGLPALLQAKWIPPGTEGWHTGPGQACSPPHCSVVGRAAVGVSSGLVSAGAGVPHGEAVRESPR